MEKHYKDSTIYLNLIVVLSSSSSNYVKTHMSHSTKPFRFSQEFITVMMENPENEAVDLRDESDLRLSYELSLLTNSSCREPPSHLSGFRSGVCLY